MCFWPKRKTVELLICEGSALLANPYCLSVVLRKFYVDPRPGEPVAPAAPCAIHVKPVDPPLPLVDVFFGVYDFFGALGDRMACLQRIQIEGLEGGRFFVCYSWQGPQPDSPYLQVGTWTHDNGITFPLYRLGNPDAPSWNPVFWDRLTSILVEMKRLGLTAWLVAEDYCSLKGNSTVKYWNPFYSSEEALGPSTPGGVWGEAMRPYHSALFGKIIETAKAAGVETIFEVMNEADIVDGTAAEVVAWNAWAHGEVQSFAFPKERIVASPGQGAAEIVKQVGLYSPHQIGTPDEIVPMAGADIRATIFSSDGVFDGTGPADANGRRGIGMDVAPEMGRRLLEADAAGFELLFRDAYREDNNRGNVDGLDWTIAKAIAFPG